MYLEAEVYAILRWGFYIILGMELICVIFLWQEYKFIKDALFWFIIHIFCFGLAGFKLLEAIHAFDRESTIDSKEVSANIWLSGGLWIVSISCLLIGLSRLLSRSEKRKA